MALVLPILRAAVDNSFDKRMTTNVVRFVLRELLRVVSNADRWSGSETPRAKYVIGRLQRMTAGLKITQQLWLSLA
jgi:hypothetical protein